MKSSLQTLTRIQKFNIDEQRKLLAVELDREEKLLKDIQALITAFEQEKEFARSHANVGDFGLYVKCYLSRREALEEALATVRRKIAEIRDVIADMFKEQKTFEIVEANRQSAAAKEIEAKEQKMLDEIGTNTYIKHKQD